MARPTLMKLALVIALTMAAGTAFAAGTNITATTAVGNSSFSPSNNVTIGCASSNTDYSVYSKHLNGDRVMGIYSADPKIYYSISAAGTTVSAPSASNANNAMSASSSGWTSM